MPIVAYSMPVHSTGLITPPNSSGRLGIMGRHTAYSRPTKVHVTRWMPQATAKMPGWKLFSMATFSASTLGTNTPASRLMGNHTLPSRSRPHATAAIAMATPPASPPHTPLR